MNEGNEKILKEFKDHVRKMELLGGTMALLDWDSRVYMPAKGVERRGDALGYLAGEYHKMSTSEKVKEFVEAFEGEKDLDEVTSAMLRDVKKQYERSLKIPAQFEEEYSILCTKSSSAWRKAKASGDFEVFRPYLEKIAHMKFKCLDFLGCDKNKYDTLLDDFEGGMTVEKLDVLFGELKEGIVDLLDRIKNSDVEINDDILKVHVSKETQVKLCNFILENMGFDFEAGRMDETEHPFTTSFCNKDVRITNHYYENDFTNALFSAIHEGGHAIYEQDIPDSLENTGVNSAASLGIHESQSRFYENIIGRSYEFWTYFYKEIQNEIPEFKSIDLDDFYKVINKVKPSLIRTTSDELTYSLHVIIRYEIEKDLIAGKIKVKDLPEIWNNKYKEYLGVEPKNNSEGVLQDTHWADGTIGYFPSYALGNLYGAQFLNKMLQDIPDVYEDVSKGDLTQVHQWLKENVHKYGAIYTPVELIKKVTGEELTAKYFLQYLNEKYSKIYNL